MLDEAPSAENLAPATGAPTSASFVESSGEPDGAAAVPSACADASGAELDETQASEPGTPAAGVDKSDEPAQADGAPASGAASFPALLEQLGSADEEVQLRAAEAMERLCGGERDAPADAAACNALLENDIVSALLRLVKLQPAAAAASERRLDVTRAALRAFAALSDVFPPTRDAVLEANGVPILLAVLKHAIDADVLDGASRVLWYCSHSMRVVNFCARQGLHVAFLNVLRRPGLRASTLAACTVAVQNLAVPESNRDAIRAAGGIPLLVGLLREAAGAPTVNAAAAALCNLCIHNDANSQAACAKGAVEALEALQQPSCGIRTMVAANVARALEMLDDVRLTLPGAVARCVAQLTERADDEQAVNAALDSLFKLCTGNRTHKKELWEAGDGAALTALLSCPSADIASSAACTIWSACEDSPKNAEAVRAAGGISALLALVTHWTDINDETVMLSMGALMTLSNVDALHAALVQADTLAVVEPVVRTTNDDKTQLLGLLLVACAYSSQSNAIAEALLLSCCCPSAWIAAGGGGGVWQPPQPPAALRPPRRLLALPAAAAQQ
jgi:hypothetical protein